MMRKISLLLVLCMLFACLVSCDGKNEGKTENTGTGAVSNPAQITGTVEETDGENKTKEPEATKEPETPQDNWTQRY